MFTGLIEDVGRVAALAPMGAGARLMVFTGLPLEDIRLGDSIAVNGVCLTVVESGEGLFSFDVSPETMERTTFRTLRPGAAVNLERALRIGDRLGGHLVSGHVDCIAVIRERRESSGNILFSFRLPGRFARYCIEKGSVAIDGISLTINSVSADGFSVNIIPHTGNRTTLSSRKPDDEVNIETDVIGKYVERLLGGEHRDGGKGVSLELLAKSGFL
ncbi:MAG: riboflavin synthase [Geobacteraceae bacterium]|nr:riboflavin synthase [Geobacteraceae bacterium]